MIKLRIHRNEYATSAIFSGTPIKWDLFVGGVRVLQPFYNF